MVKAAAIDVRELVRFIITGVIATIANFAAVWLTRHFLSYEISLLAGIVAGISMSFILSKLFAFASHSWEGAGGEAVRFLVVYAFSCTFYWVVAVLCRRYFIILGAAPKVAEIDGVLVGASTMMLTSYFGHRFFTYRSYRHVARRPDTAS